MCCAVCCVRVMTRQRGKGKAGGDGKRNRNRTCFEPVRCPFGLRPPRSAAPSHASAVQVSASSREAAIAPSLIQAIFFYYDCILKPRACALRIRIGIVRIRAVPVPRTHVAI
jgi:hypothetical protein